MRAVVTGVGARLPDGVVSNDDLAARVATSDEWIRQRTGIAERRQAAPGEATSDLAVAAARKALTAAGLGPADVDLIVVATTTPDLTFPATATIVQRKLGAPPGIAFDVQAVCSGFIYALAVAESFVVRGQARHTLVIGAETMTRLLDWEDRGTCVLFGDGAGAVVLEAEEAAGEPSDRGVLACWLRADGRGQDLLYVDGGPSLTGTVGKLRMQGKEVFRHAVVNIAEAVVEAARLAAVAVDDIDWFIPHQANQRIIDGVGKRLGINPARVISTVERHANTSAASVPLAMAEGIADGRIRPGQLLMLEAMGGGLTWGAAALRL